MDLTIDPKLLTRQCSYREDITHTERNETLAFDSADPSFPDDFAELTAMHEDGRGKDDFESGSLFPPSHVYDNHFYNAMDHEQKSSKKKDLHAHGTLQQPSDHSSSISIRHVVSSEHIEAKHRPILDVSVPNNVNAYPSLETTTKRKHYICPYSPCTKVYTTASGLRYHRMRCSVKSTARISRCTGKDKCSLK